MINNIALKTISVIYNIVFAGRDNSLHCRKSVLPQWRILVIYKADFSPFHAKDSRPIFCTETRDGNLNLRVKAENTGKGSFISMSHIIRYK